VEAAGGKIVTRYYTRLAIRRLLAGQSESSAEPLPFGVERVEAGVEKASESGFKYGLPDPTGRWHLEYYRDPAHRRYLSGGLKAGENPSLFFGVPTEKKGKKKVKSHKKSPEEERIF